MISDDVPAFNIVERKINEINPDIRIEDVNDNIDKGIYFFFLTRGERRTTVTFSREFLADLRDCPNKGRSKYWKELDSTLTKALLDSMENKGLIDFTKDKLKELIFQHIKALLQNYDHVNKYNVLGKPYRGAEGSLERSLNLMFTEDERVNAGLAFEELKRENVIIPTYKDLVSPEDWVKVKEKSKSSKAKAEKESIKIGDLKKVKEIPIKEIFMSSTIENLVDCRAEVIKELESKGIKVIHSGSPDFAGLPPNNTSDICLERVHNAPIFILIIDCKCGSPYEGKHEHFRGISITHAEFRKAREDKSKPVLVYVRDEVWKEYKLWKNNPSLICNTEKEIFEMLREYDSEKQWISPFITSVELKDMIIKRLGIS